LTLHRQNYQVKSIGSATAKERFPLVHFNQIQGHKLFRFFPGTAHGQRHWEKTYIPSEKAIMESRFPSLVPCHVGHNEKGSRKMAPWGCCSLFAVSFHLDRVNKQSS
jgi:hypothetical protein